MTATVNLTALAETRGKMTFRRLAECCPDQDDSHPCRLLWASPDVPALVLTGPDPGTEVAKVDVRGIVATQNAADVLIEVARAALRVRAAAIGALRACMEARTEGNITALARAEQEEQMAADAYDAALAKVSL